MVVDDADPFGGSQIKPVDSAADSDVEVRLVTDYDESTDLQVRIWN